MNSLRIPGRPRVIILPGLGEPADRRDDLRPVALAQRLVDRLGHGERTLLIGHSASCQVVAHAARLAPDRVAGLVLIGPSTDPRAATWPRLVARLLATAPHEDPRQIPALVRQYSTTGPRSMIRTMNVARRDRIDHTLELVECPVLVIRGVHDRVCPEDWAVTLTTGSASPDERRTWITLSAGAHMVPFTHGPLVAAAISGARL